MSKIQPSRLEVVNLDPKQYTALKGVLGAKLSNLSQNSSGEVFFYHILDNQLIKCYFKANPIQIREISEHIDDINSYITNSNPLNTASKKNTTSMSVNSKEFIEESLGFIPKTQKEREVFSEISKLEELTNPNKEQQARLEKLSIDANEYHEKNGIIPENSKMSQGKSALKIVYLKKDEANIGTDLSNIMKSNIAKKSSKLKEKASRSLANTRDKIRDNIGGTLSDTVSTIIQTASDTRDKVTDIVSNARKTATNKLSNAKEEIAWTALKTSIDATNKLSDAKDKANDIVSNARETATNTLSNAKDKVTKTASKAKKVAAESLSDAKDKITDIVSDARKTATNKLSNANEIASKAKRVAAEGFYDATGQIVETASKAKKVAAKGFYNTTSKIVETASKAKEESKNILSKMNNGKNELTSRYKKFLESKSSSKFSTILYGISGVTAAAGAIASIAGLAPVALLLYGIAIITGVTGVAVDASRAIYKKFFFKPDAPTTDIEPGLSQEKSQELNKEQEKAPIVLNRQNSSQSFRPNQTVNMGEHKETGTGIGR